MSDNKTIQGKLNEVSCGGGLLKMLSENDGLIQYVELWLINDKKHRNKWTFGKLKEHLNLLAGIPILVAYVDGELGKKSGHNFRQVRQPDGSVIATFLDDGAEHIVGLLGNEEDIRLEHKDGKEWVVAKGKLWKWYAQELVAKIKKQGLEGQQISIETLVMDYIPDEENDPIYTKWMPLGVTVLGDGVEEAVAGANIRALSAMGIDKIREETLRVASVYQAQTQNPQTKNNKEKQTIMNKKSLNNMFKNCQILGVVGSKVALLSCDKHEAYVSSVTKDDSGALVEGGKIAVNATVVFGEGENEVKLALDSVIETFKAENEELKGKITDNEKTIKALSETNEKMKSQETTRRKNAVKTAIDSRFAEIKANSKADFADDEVDDLKAEEKLCAFAAMEDKDGVFIGEKEAVKAVDARCMDKVIKAGKVMANSKQKAYVWDEQAGGGQSKAKDGLDELIDEFTNKD